MTPLLQQAREALQSVRLADNVSSILLPGARKAVMESLTALDTYEALSDYDKAIHDLAKYLPDGWVAQDAALAFTTFFTMRPGRGEFAWDSVSHETEKLVDSPLIIPECDDWRKSLRRIKSGRVLPQGEV